MPLVVDRSVFVDAAHSPHWIRRALQALSSEHRAFEGVARFVFEPPFFEAARRICESDTRLVWIEVDAAAARRAALLYIAGNTTTLEEDILDRQAAEADDTLKPLSRFS